MSEPEKLAIALLLLRLGTAWVFLSAAYGCMRTAVAWNMIRHETELFFPFLAPSRRRQAGFYAAIIGMLMMVGGGLSLLLGIEPRLGGLTIALFSFLGLRIHSVRRAEALALARDGVAIATTAYSALSASGKKNLVLIAVGIAFFLLGAGPYSLGIDHFG